MDYYLKLLMITKLPIEEALQLNDSLWIDARSPKEYQEDHIKDAINLPLLNNEERHEIGLIYKQISREQAIEKGLGFYSQKIPTIITTVKDHWEKNIVIYCARGGMRSGIIASLLDSIGMKVFQVQGGYKLFRNYLVQELYDFKIKPKIVVLWGLTCTGKTDLLKLLPNSLDLEGLAQHRGSLMGALGKNPHSQKKFENLLLDRLRKLNKEKVIFVEGESRRIGDVIIPPSLWKAISNGINIHVSRNTELRIKCMVDEYFPAMNVEKIKTIIPQFRDVISNNKKQEIVDHITNNNHTAAARMILEDYYDPLYAHTLNKLNYTTEINTDHLNQAQEQLQTFVKTLV
jgi:tRNA 2-selenouridine synthase